MRKRNATLPKAVHGRLDTILENSGESVWAFREELRTGHMSEPRPLQNGDFLRVFNDAAGKHEIFSGEVELEFKSNRQPLPRRTHLVAQCIKGVGPVHGIQKDTDPEAWGEMFVAGKPATLIPASRKHLP